MPHGPRYILLVNFRSRVVVESHLLILLLHFATMNGLQDEDNREGRFGSEVVESDLLILLLHFATMNGL